MAPGNKNKVLVDWSCADCTKGAKYPQKGPNANKSGHLNYKDDKHCRKCKAPKGSCHLCAYSDLGPKLKEGHRANGNDTAANNSKSGGGGGAQTKREKDQAKEIADLKKQLGQSKPDVDGGTEADAAGSGADVKVLRANLARYQQFLEDYRLIFFDEVLPEAVVAKQDEFETSPYLADVRARIAVREKALSDATPTGQRAQQLDREIKNAEAAVKKQEAATTYSK